MSTGTYTTKVLKASNLRAIARAKDALEQELARAEAEKATGTVSIEVSIKDGGTWRTRRHCTREENQPQD